MKFISMSAAVAASLTLAVFSAHASCADPRMLAANADAAEAQLAAAPALPDSTGEDNSGKSSARERVVGTWLVTYTAAGAPFANAFIQWHDDYTEWESINMPVLNGTICLGSWKAVDSMHVYRSHIGWLYADGKLTGHFTETETDEVAKDGKSYYGTNVTKIYDLDGHKLAEIPGTSKASKLVP
jgi:hypothetical protein